MPMHSKCVVHGCFMVKSDRSAMPVCSSMLHQEGPIPETINFLCTVIVTINFLCIVTVQLLVLVDLYCYHFSKFVHNHMPCIYLHPKP